MQIITYLPMNIIVSVLAPILI